MPCPHYHVRFPADDATPFDVIWGDLDLAERHRALLRTCWSIVSVDIHPCYQESCYAHHDHTEPPQAQSACA